uniref:Probable LRR receptor-like serine/threonine-protein kinase At2g23950 n=1 Tax=Cicer arietinum TaxID=3827 RepID=A0A3Q7XI20_CICAR|nr:probable LRR receptor-like serine/threonine-protein kinase At2g23950 [Cicer arietinum]
MSNMHQLSSLDLSSNRLSGTIPSSLSFLSFLGSLDLSDNNLFGAIPYTGQMTTFDATDFTENPGLCGPPLPVRCSAGILVPYFILIIKSSWGDIYFDFVDHVVDKLSRLTHRQGINHGQRRKIHHRRQFICIYRYVKINELDPCTLILLCTRFASLNILA